MAVEEAKCDHFGWGLDQMVPLKNLEELLWYEYLEYFYERKRKNGVWKISWQVFAER